MKILIIGGGGREHALAWKAAQSQQVSTVFVAPGNAGTALEAKVNNIAIDPLDCEALKKFARQEDIALTIVGPEAPLAAGIVDQFQAAGLRCLGPSQQAAQLETSKTFSKQFMSEHGIPTAGYASFTDKQQALNYIARQSLPLVIKADGLAAGKGVVIAHTEEQAIQAATDMLSGDAFGKAGRQIVIEEFLQGEEASFMVICDGEHVIPLATSQDHKARDNGDKGPNTGGMGAYSPAPVITDELSQHIMQTVILPTVTGLQAAGTPYTGFLYAGLMITPDGAVKVLEFNCRLGDPETQPLLLRLQSDFIQLCNAAVDKQLSHVQLKWDPRPALTVVLASKGYPGAYTKGQVIHNLPAGQRQNYKIFHAATSRQDDNIITQGGRVLSVTASGDTYRAAQQAAYDLAQQIHWQDLYYRTDIGYRAIARESC